MMNRTFFEQIGIADRERIHTQMLQWIFSSDFKALTREHKIEMINLLIGKKISDIIGLYTEFEKIDLLIESLEYVICLENKLKSSEHSNQLERYRENIKAKFSKPIVFIFLTLIEEHSSQTDWNNISYRNLLNIFDQYYHLCSLAEEHSFHRSIFREYIETIRNLVNIADDFTQSPSYYNNVFRINSDEPNVTCLKKKMVSTNKLETIFQKLYFRKVAEELGLKANCYISETRGNAILGIPIALDIEINNKLFNFGFDTQNGRFKTYCTAKNYEESSKDDMSVHIINAFDTIRDNFSTKGYTGNCNKPRTKAQCSVTKPIKGWGSYSIKEFSDLYQKELEIAIEIINEHILPKFQKN